MLLETVQKILHGGFLDERSRASLEVNFRALAGSNLQGCADIDGIFARDYGIELNGSDVEMTCELFLNAFILTTAINGSNVKLSDKKASILAKRKNLVVENTDRQSMSVWVLGEIGLNTESGEWGSFDEVSEDELQNEDVLEEKEEEEVQEKSEFEEDKEKIKQYYFQFYKGVVMELAKRYTSLFESGYEVSKPAGILSKDGMIGLSGNKRVVKKFNISVMNMYKLLNSKLDFMEVPVRSNIKIADTIYENYSNGSKKLLYFPNKLLEYAYGRKAPSGDSKDSLNTYENHSNSANWRAYCKSEVEKSLMAVVGSSVVKFIYLSAEGGDYFNDDLAVRLQDFLKYLQSCLSLCLLMVEYKSRVSGYDEDIFAFKVRVCDPLNSLGYFDITKEIIDKAFMGSTGDVPFSYKPRIEDTTFIKEYAHEFNHDSSQAMPLFAYKAYLALKAQGIEPTWNNMILGMFEDGTILKNGKQGVSLESRLTHHDVAGSRAGKGVMTLNLLASGLYSNKAIFYLDRKPDMASMLRYLSPNMFVVNGGGYGAQYDTYKQFGGLDSQVNWSNVPQYVGEVFGREKNWDELGDLFYMRALKLAMGIVVARGSGKFNDLQFGGEDGILIVVDEFKNFQESFSTLVDRALAKVPPSTRVVDESKIEKAKNDKEKQILEESYRNSYNNSSYYALSYLNSLVEDLKYLSEIRDAGFNQKELELSDIFVIGQSLGHGSLDFKKLQNAIDDSSSSERYKSMGRTGLKSTVLNTSESFPFSLVSFKTSDAFFGRNMEDGRSVYFAQTNKESKAFGRLDDKASNFAYMGTFDEDTRKKIVGGNTQVNIELANKCIYFKPFLVLNDAKPGDLYTEGMFARCAGAGNEKGKEWVSREEIIAENPNSDGTFVNEAVGFEGYLKLMGISDYSARLEKSCEIANYVVRECLGYSGNWFEFITDLRPQWLFTIKDIVDGSKGIKPQLLDIDKNSVLKEFVRFNPSVFGLEDGSSYEDIEISEDMSVSDFMDDSDYYDNDYQKEQEIIDKEMRDLFDNDDSIAEEDEDIIDFFNDDIEDDLYTHTKDSSIHETGFDTEDDLSMGYKPEEEIQALLLRLKELGVNVDMNPSMSERAYMEDIEYGRKEYKHAKGGFVFYDSIDKSEFNDDIEYNGDINSLSRLVEIVTEDVLKKFGGLNEIVSFKVIGGSIIVNGYCYRCRVGDLFARNIPYDLKREMNSGDISRLFDYSKLLRMPRLRDLEFDSANLVYDYVSYGMGYGSQISVDLFFRDLRALQRLCIGRKLFKKETLDEQLDKEDVFYKPRVATKFANYSEELLGRYGNSSWEFTKRTMKSKEYGGVMKFFGVTGGLMATGVTKGGRVAVKGTRKLTKGIRTFAQSFKDAMEESKKY